MMILILTYGKVASTSLRSMLMTMFPGEVFYTHGLQEWMTKPFADFAAQACHDVTGLKLAFAENPLILDRLKQAEENGEDVVIVSGMRDPVERSLSVAMQTLETVFNDCNAGMPEVKARKLADSIVKYWKAATCCESVVDRVSRIVIRAPFDWFEEEIEKAFGIDLLAEKFDTERGFKVYRRGRLSLLMFRQENAPAAIEQGLSEIFPGRSFALLRENVGLEKPSKAVYTHLKKCFSLSTDELSEIYASPYVRHFYTEEEITRSVHRWSSPQRQQPPMPVSSEPVRATVIIAMLNHAQWIGSQLDSLFSQWRDELDLLVIDDGSSDNGLAVVNARLANHPDVRATVLRNERPLGLGVLPQLLKYSKNQIFIQSDSDDIALPGRIDAILSCFNQDPDCRLVTSNAMLLSDDGLPIGLYDVSIPDEVLRDPVRAASKFGSSQWLGASEAFHRSLLELFPSDVEECPYELDLILAFRATLVGTHHYLSTPLVGWRQHARNSHRLVGSLARDGALHEHFAAVELMTLAQKLHDAELAWARSADRELMARVVRRCNDVFFERFAEWSKSRSRAQRMWDVTAGGKEPGYSQPVSYVPPLPPVMTLSKGQLFNFGLHGSLGEVAASWSGIHLPEPGWNWTSRSALLVFRLVEPLPVKLVFCVSGLAYLPAQKVRLTVNFQVSVTKELDESQYVELGVDVPGTSDSGYVSVLVEVSEAGIPSQMNVGNADTRLLGVMLHWISVV